MRRMEERPLAFYCKKLYQRPCIATLSCKFVGIKFLSVLQFSKSPRSEQQTPYALSSMAHPAMALLMTGNGHLHIGRQHVKKTAYNDSPISEQAERTGNHRKICPDIPHQSCAVVFVVVIPTFVRNGGITATCINTTEAGGGSGMTSIRSVGSAPKLTCTVPSQSVVLIVILY